MMAAGYQVLSVKNMLLKIAEKLLSLGGGDSIFQCEQARVFIVNETTPIVFNLSAVTPDRALFKGMVRC